MRSTRTKGEPTPLTRSGPARLLLADDHGLIRAGLRHMLSREQGLEVVGEATNGLEAVQLCRRLKPDLVLMDVRMPQMDGLEATRQVKAHQPEVRVLVVSTYEDPEYMFEALKAGAAGYVLKGSPNSEIIGSIRGVLEGESPLDQELAAKLIQGLAKETATRGAKPIPIEISTTEAPSAGRRDVEPADAPTVELTPRELEVLDLLTQGQTNAQIAQTLAISTATAKVHVEHLIHKLGTCDRTQAVMRAIALGLLVLD
jgi:DNA-binding NarL/FixJ family response regulator